MMTENQTNAGTILTAAGIIFITPYRLSILLAGDTYSSVKLLTVHIFQASLPRPSPERGCDTLGFILWWAGEA